MRPSEFWRSTPRDISDMGIGAFWRERRDWQRLAWLAATVIAPHVTQIPGNLKQMAETGPDDVLSGLPEEKTPEEARAFVEEIVREHKKKFWTLISDEFSADGDKDIT